MSKVEGTTLSEARKAKPAAQKIFTGLVGEVAVGITRVGGHYGLKVNLASSPAANVTLPTTVEGVPVHVEVTGTIRKRAPKHS
jgi:hypothetical protein